MQEENVNAYRECWGYDAYLHRVVADEAHNAHGPCLAEAVHPRQRLLLHSHIQRGLQQEDIAGCRRTAVSAVVPCGGHRQNLRAAMMAEDLPGCAVNRACHILEHCTHTSRTGKFGVGGGSVIGHCAAAGCALRAGFSRMIICRGMVALGESEAGGSLAARQKEDLGLGVLLELLDDLPGALHHIQPFIRPSSTKCVEGNHI